jgi:hypothetical protein
LEICNIVLNEKFVVVYKNQLTKHAW